MGLEGQTVMSGSRLGEFERVLKAEVIDLSLLQELAHSGVPDVRPHFIVWLKKKRFNSETRNGLRKTLPSVESLVLEPINTEGRMKAVV